jgi:FkbM family methyltransferase
MKMIKNLIKNFLSIFRLQLHRIPTPEQLKQIVEAQHEFELNKKLWLRNAGVKTILDIGANTGQFAKLIHELCPEAKLYSFEPLKDCYQELVANFKNVSQFQAFNVALGDNTGVIEMHRSEYSPSSSLLTMNDLHKKAFPYTKEEIIQKVELVCLDDLTSSLELRKPLLIKLDVQGYEDKVISGGKSVISQADILIVELSIEQLYDGQPLFNEIYQTLISLGFKYRGNYDQLCSPDDGRVLQVDGIFTKSLF